MREGASVDGVIKGPGVLLALCLWGMVIVGILQTPPARWPEIEPLAINQASAEEIRVIPGVGPTLARRIEQNRAAYGPFRNREDLTRVHGIGPRLSAAIGRWSRFTMVSSPSP